jgi:hypothetical protein
MKCTELISFNAIYEKKAYLPEAAHYGAKLMRIKVASPRHIVCGGNLAYLVFACLLQKPNVLN